MLGKKKTSAQTTLAGLLLAGVFVFLGLPLSGGISAWADGTGYWVDPWTDPEPLPGHEISRILSPKPVLSIGSHAALRQAARDYQEIVRKGGFVRIDSGPLFRQGERSPRVTQLRARLAQTGDLESQYRLGEEFDAAVHGAVRSFQLRNGLSPDGAVGSKTLAALNVSAQRRYNIINQNLARISALPEKLGSRYVHVNIAGAELEAVQSDEVVMRRRVVVGLPDRATPQITSKITYLTFNPYWTIPPSIARKDIIPKARADRSYLRDRNIRVFSSWNAHARELDSSSVDWSAAASKQYMLRQDPSPNNSLGSMRIHFANSHSVYLHDTPAQSLFDRYGRAYSSGCVRVERIEDVAEWLFMLTPGVDRHVIEARVRAGTRSTASLASPVPIYMTYLTAWVDGTGRVQFRDDIYGLDGPGA